MCHSRNPFFLNSRCDVGDFRKKKKKKTRRGETRTDELYNNYRQTDAGPMHDEKDAETDGRQKKVAKREEREKTQPER